MGFAGVLSLCVYAGGEGLLQSAVRSPQSAVCISQYSEQVALNMCALCYFLLPSLFVSLAMATL